MKTRLYKILSIVLVTVLLLQSVYIPAFAKSTTQGDPMVYLTQKWLNQQYGDVEGFGTVTENGKTGWDTVYGLLRALQHELGITALANSFGPTTTALYSENLLYRQDGVSDKKFAILQGALWCKGYFPGYKLHENADGTVVFDEVFDDVVEQAVIELKTDAGFTDPDGVVTLDVMKALMSMDTFKLLSSYGGKPEVRAMQQKLNRKYGEYIGIIPCDGVYGRSTGKALIYALQAQELLPTGVANGNFGNTTRRCCPELPYVKNATAAKSYTGEYYTDSQIAGFTELLQFALFVNGIGDGVTDGVFDDGTKKDITDFQKKMALPVTGKADITTWMSLLVSCGDTTRSAVAADCATILTEATAKTLYDNGYRYIGRYLTVASKAITKEEAQIIFDAGLRFFPIYQTSANYADYFTAAQGVKDAQSAMTAANGLGLPEDTVIYFAVDLDCTDSQITSIVLPYFEKVYAQMKNSGYRVGVYGTRNVCTRVSEKGYASLSFVSDMSTEYSGNLGFKMPDNWAFDQFATVSIGSGAGKLEIDKNGYSGKDAGVSQLTNKTVTLLDTSKIFNDVKADAWYKKFVDYAVTHDIFDGVSTTEFSPNTNMTRAQFVQVFANITGIDTSDRQVSSGFRDVPKGKWYTGAVTWAAKNGVVSGMGNGTFAPDADVTREQMCVMLTNYVEKYKKSALKVQKDAPAFADDKDIAKWAKASVYKCADAALVSGVGNNRFDPKSSATRAQGATIFSNLHKEYI